MGTTDDRNENGSVPVTARVYLALGSNISPRRAFLVDSLQQLYGEVGGNLRCSSFYRTTPYHGLQQPYYINLCVVLKTRRSPLALLQFIQQIEHRQGRIRSGWRWESRCIDIDILLWGDRIIDQPALTIPHYDISCRDFFLIPLLELDPNLINPRSGIGFSEELAEIPEHLKTHPQKTEPPLW
jgi:2-amino-4-hydroxy-6-hydroxymethyldihydropteridine diphosphokinase